MPTNSAALRTASKVAGIRKLPEAGLTRHEVQQLAEYVATIERTYPRLLRRKVMAGRHARIKQFINRLWVEKGEA